MVRRFDPAKKVVSKGGSAYGIMSRKSYKKYWKTNIKNPWVVIRTKKRGKSVSNIPQKTFKTTSDAKDYVYTKALKRKEIFGIYRFREKNK